METHIVMYVIDLLLIPSTIMNEVFDLLVLDTDFYTLQNNETNSVKEFYYTFITYKRM